MTKKQKQIVLASFLVVLTAVAGGLIYAKTLSCNSEACSNTETLGVQTQVFTSDDITFAYPSELTLGIIGPTDKEQGIIARFQGENDSEPILITVRKETNLRLPASVTRTSVIDLLIDNANSALPDRYPGYKLLGQERYDIDSREAAELVFSYQKEGEPAATQKFVIIEKDDDTALYLLLQTSSAGYQSADQLIFKSLLDSIALQ